MFPTLAQENLLGYDLLIRRRYVGRAWPYILQFKVSDYLTAKWSDEWHKFNAPYYRFSVYRACDSPQHKLLKSIAENLSTVYYCGSGFPNCYAFSQCYTQKAVVKRTAFVPVGPLPEISDTEQHRIVFDTQLQYGYWCSKDPRPVEVLQWEGIVSRVPADEPRTVSELNGLLGRALAEYGASAGASLVELAQLLFRRSGAILLLRVA